MDHQVLLIGATGKLGGFFVDALIEGGCGVSALVRGSSEHDPARTVKLQAMRDRGVILHEGDLHDRNAVERATEAVDAVVSCIDHRPDNLKAQAILAEVVARSDRVRRVVPSQFGIDSRLYGETRVEHGDVKRQMQQVFREAGAPTTFVHNNGMASDWVGSLGQLGLLRPPENSVEIYGSGKVAFSTVAAEDVARFATRALFDPRAEDRHVLIAPPENILTQNDLVALWTAKTGVPIRKEQVTSDALDDRIESLAAIPTARPLLAMAQLVRAAWIDGLGDGRHLPDVLELTALYPELGYVQAADFLDRYRVTEVFDA
ncbi:NmrA family NAD(P)-binding protein [Rhizobium leguminosarum]|jgi:uncharacterized protein YbjT (DUF2867 family)|uniref:NmrA family NAD(P)-binding protein n=1 Tax=Rhizobium ruizarguesonis TaxID=2081791 RepID=UPI00103B7FAA|nr:NmrA family NAD(P)-binding protein [Rhizobium ruizarguesonis]NEI05284.1 NmrA family NAD(P)-binding protein [Rhizobium ruizarguesonis]TCA30104.1 NAD-dependent epimerase/dehydratase family protein [Rhizobium leguminosarum bv. viciae]